MILGDCPYNCGYPLMLPISDPPGVRFERHACEGCGKIIWTRHSRVNPWSMTEADFLAAYDVDPVSRSVAARTQEEEEP